MSNEKRAEILAKIMAGKLNIDYPKAEGLDQWQQHYLESAIGGATASFMGAERCSPIALMPESKEHPECLEMHQLGGFNDKTEKNVNSWFNLHVEERGLVVFVSELWRATSVKDGVTKEVGESVGIRLWTPKFSVMYLNPIADKDGHRFLTKWELQFDTRKGGKVAPIIIRDAVSDTGKN